MRKLVHLIVVLVVMTSAGVAGPAGASGQPAEPQPPRSGDQFVTEAPERQRERTSAWQAQSLSESSAAALMLGDEYYDECDDAPSADIAKFIIADDQAADVLFGWATCQGRPMGSDEVVIFAIDQDLYDPNFAHDYVVAQWMDGYYEVHRTYDSSPEEFWTLLDWGYGELDRTVAGRTTGAFLIDAVASTFPLEYYFAVQTFDADGSQDIIPNAGHGAPTFPSGCDSFIFRHKAVVRSTDVEATAAAAAAAGLDVESLAPGVGALTVSPVERLWELDLPGQLAAHRPVAYQMAAVNDPEPSQWAIDQLNLEAAWTVRSSAAVEIAVVDSGVDATRPDLAGRVAAGFDAVSGLPIPAGANSALAPHGTAVAGIAAGAAGNGKEIAGVNRGAIIRPYRVFGHTGSCVESGALVAALDHISTVDSIRIVNMSLGGPVYDPTTHAAVTRLAGMGKILVAASGNDGHSGFGAKYPASLPEVIAVGATGPGPTVATYSQPASTEVVAPGGSGETRADGIATLDEFDLTTFGMGTSYATPYVSGALSLWLGSGRATTDEARAALRAAVTDLPGTTADGYGLLDVARLVGAGDAADPGPTARDITDTCAQVPKVEFADTAGSVHRDSISCVAGWELTAGKTATTFDPAGSLTRGQTATFLVRTLEAAGHQLPAAADACSETGVHTDNVERLISARIIPAPPSALCNSGRDITREGMAFWTAGALAFAGVATPPATDWYTDDDTSTYQDEINTITSLGIVTGTGEGRFEPAATLRRAQMATFLARTLDALLATDG